MLVNAKCAPHYIKTILENAHLRQGYGGQAESAREPFDAAQPGASRSGPTPEARAVPGGYYYMGIRPNGDVTPCPYLPVFAGSLRSASLADLWTSSELFTGIRRRTSLGGRCGECEMNGHCGGCRARAYGMTGDLMAEDPLCTHTPGKFAGSPLLLARRSLGEGGASEMCVRLGSAGGSGDRVRHRIADDDRVGRCGRRADEEDPCVRPGDGHRGRRGVLPQERPRPRDHRRARADPRPDADAETFRVGVAIVRIRPFPGPTGIHTQATPACRSASC